MKKECLIDYVKKIMFLNSQSIAALKGCDGPVAETTVKMWKSENENLCYILKCLYELDDK